MIATVSKAINLDTRIKARPDFPGSSVDGDLVIFDAEKGAYYGSGPVGHRIWNLLAEETSIREICEVLVGQFDVDWATCEAQVTRFAGDLHDKGLVTLA